MILFQASCAHHQLIATQTGCVRIVERKTNQFCNKELKKINWFQWEKRFGVTRQDQSQKVEINGTLSRVNINPATFNINHKQIVTDRFAVSQVLLNFFQDDSIISVQQKPTIFTAVLHQNDECHPVAIILNNDSCYEDDSHI